MRKNTISPNLRINQAEKVKSPFIASDPATIKPPLKSLAPPVLPVETNQTVLITVPLLECGIIGYGISPSLLNE